MYKQNSSHIIKKKTHKNFILLTILKKMIQKQHQILIKSFNYIINNNFSSKPMNLNQCYLELQIPVTSNFKIIKSTFYKLSKQYHPDLNKEQNSAEKFKKINQAFQTIKQDFEKRGLNTSTGDMSEEDMNAQWDSDQYKYSRMTKEDVYFSVFGKTYDEDPMFYYNSKNEHLKKKYEKELLKWQMYQENDLNEQEQEYYKEQMKTQEQKQYENQYSSGFYSDQERIRKQKTYQEGQNNNHDVFEPKLLALVLGLVGFGIYLKLPTNQITTTGQGKSIDHAKVDQWRDKFKEKQKVVTEARQQKKKIAEDLYYKNIRHYQSLESQRQQIDFFKTLSEDEARKFIPKVFWDSIPNVESYDYIQKCSCPNFKKRKIGMLLHNLSLDPTFESEHVVRQKYKFCLGYV